MILSSLSHIDLGHCESNARFRRMNLSFGQVFFGCNPRISPSVNRRQKGTIDSVATSDVGQFPTKDEVAQRGLTPSVPFRQQRESLFRCQPEPLDEQSSGVPRRAMASLWPHGGQMLRSTTAAVVSIVGSGRAERGGLEFGLRLDVRGVGRRAVHGGPAFGVYGVPAFCRASARLDSLGPDQPQTLERRQHRGDRLGGLVTAEHATPNLLPGHAVRCASQGFQDLVGVAVPRPPIGVNLRAPSERRTPFSRGNPTEMRRLLVEHHRSQLGGCGIPGECDDPTRASSPSVRANLVIRVAHLSEFLDFLISLCGREFRSQSPRNPR